MGAKNWYHRGEADEATSLELVVEPWIEKLDGPYEEEQAKVGKLDKKDLEVYKRETE